MPNGDPNFDFQGLEEFFAPIASALESFARTHGILIEKYYHDSPSWSLCFKHPSGGEAKISVSRSTGDSVTIGSVWWQDDYDAYTRNLKWGTKITCPKNSDELYATLEQELASVISWKESDWNDTAKGYKRIWGRYSKGEFEAMAPQWPLPRLSNDP